MVKRYRVCLALLLALLPACSSTPSPARSLVKTSEHFSQRLRWQDIGHAAVYLEKSERENFEAVWKAPGDDLHVVGSRVDAIEMLDPETAEVTMTIDYYLLPSATVEKLVSVQRWRYRDGAGFEVGSWELVSGAPELPGRGGQDQKGE